ncbi:Dolichol-phosphate mannosyltransferase subunit 3 [Halotydeus destructor]|nr:Dolichol-phosphate mannosyltransferase subunit 3 [Halotydeus destructor]
MTKLTEWLSLISTFVAIWLILVKGTVVQVPKDYETHVLLLPIYAIVLFGLASASVVAYRVATFNDCPEAAEELRRQIKEAKSDLQSKGFKFGSVKKED